MSSWKCTKIEQKNYKVLLFSPSLSLSLSLFWKGGDVLSRLDTTEKTKKKSPAQCHGPGSPPLVSVVSWESTHTVPLCAMVLGGSPLVSVLSLGNQHSPTGGEDAILGPQTGLKRCI